MPVVKYTATGTVVAPPLRSKALGKIVMGYIAATESDTARLSTRIYKYGLPYKLNFIPGLLFILALYACIAILPSNNKIIGYLFLSAIVFLLVFLFAKERVKVAVEICLNDVGITANGFNSTKISINWNDIQSLKYTGKGCYIVSLKIERHLYAEVVSKSGKRIVIRQEIQGYEELISAIERKTGLEFIAA